MTPEMIELEFAHIAIDIKLKGGNTEQYADEDYDDYDKDSEEHDSKLSDDSLPNYVPIQNLPIEAEDEWEDVDEEDT